MKDRFNVIIDTNVIVSSLLTQNPNSATAMTLDLFYNDLITLYYSNEIYAEYNDVLHRDKFHFDKELISILLAFIKQNGILVNPPSIDKTLPDIKDKPFYEIVMDDSIRNSKLITGNLKHYPISPNIMSPADFIKLYTSKIEV